MTQPIPTAGRAAEQERELMPVTAGSIGATAGAQIMAAIERYLAEHPDGVVLEDGGVLFELAHAQYTLGESASACTLHLWSDAQNLMRRVVSATPRGTTLRLVVTRLGQRRPGTLELAPGRAVRLSAARDERRRRGVRQLERVLGRAFPDERPAGFRAAMDLQHSFGPAYARGTLVRGRELWAVIAVGEGESQATVDGVLSVALLWLEHCRQGSTGHKHVRGLRVIVPRGVEHTTSSRMRWLREDLCRFELYTLDSREETLCRVDPQDLGNTLTRLVRVPDEAAARERFRESIAQVLDLLPDRCFVTGLVTERRLSEVRARVARTMGSPDAAMVSAVARQARKGPDELPGGRGETLRAQPWLSSGQIPAAQSPAAHRVNRDAASPQVVCEVRLRPSSEVIFLCHGLEFARIRSGFAQGSFRRRDEITVGDGASETALTPDTADELRALIAELFRRRHPASPDPADPLARAQPERWLESMLCQNLPALDPSLAAAPVYTQLPALTGAGASLDRGMLDLLAITRTGRLAIIELKAQEDLHLAMQGLDYWIRVREHHLRHAATAAGLCDLQQHGYFPATRLTPEPPQLFFVAPALHVHPATETLLRYLSPAVDWTLIALDERWRNAIKPVWTRRSADSRTHL